jgi:hypothetical protein
MRHRRTKEAVICAGGCGGWPESWSELERAAFIVQLNGIGFRGTMAPEMARQCAELGATTDDLLSYLRAVNLASDRLARAVKERQQGLRVTDRCYDLIDPRGRGLCGRIFFSLLVFLCAPGLLLLSARARIRYALEQRRVMATIEPTFRAWVARQRRY